MTRRWRQLTVWLHVLTSVGWMAQAMSLCVLLSIGSGAATTAAQALDGRLSSSCWPSSCSPPALDASVVSGPGPAQIVGSGLMASAIAFQGWLSIAKPWGRIGPRRPPPHSAPAWVFTATVLGGLADLALALVIGHPMPLLSLILLIVGLSRRPRWIGGGGRRLEVPAVGQ
jgi:hypothetical protein